MLEEHVLNMPNDLLMRLFHRVYWVEEREERVESGGFHTEMDFRDAERVIYIDKIRKNKEIHTSRTIRISSKPYFVS
jgi:hypothetical protein